MKSRPAVFVCPAAARRKFITSKANRPGSPPASRISSACARRRALRTARSPLWCICSLPINARCKRQPTSPDFGSACILRFAASSAADTQNTNGPRIRKDISMTRTIAALFLFGISFGYLEAAVVVYLRAIYDPIRHRINPARQPGDLFPLISTEQLAAAGPEHPRQLAIEVGREAITILMLAAFGLAAGRNFSQRMAAFAIVFGLWDLFF